MVINLFLGAYSVPATGQAKEVKIGYVPLDVIIKPNIPTTEEEIALIKKYEDQERIQKAIKKPSPSKTQSNAGNKTAKKKYGKWDCVNFVKDLLGIYGSWGNGARKLSHNSTGQIGDVAIFKRWVHAGLVIGRSENTITVRSWMTTKKGAYEVVDTYAVNQFIGFHNF